MRTRKKRVIELYVYRHSTQPGIVVRKVVTRGGRRIEDLSKYFGYPKYDGRGGALQAALRWKRRNIGAIR